MSIELIVGKQNLDGGWPYRQGVSWTEPTAFAILAALAQGRQEAAARGAEWLRRVQRADGGFPPQTAVDESTWVTSLVALLPPDLIGQAEHARAVAWLYRVTGEDAGAIYRLRQIMLGNTDALRYSPGGWPWVPGSATWVTPTVFGILALRRAQRVRPSPEIAGRIDQGVRFLLARMCSDGGWNHGASRALGVEAQSYPETTGLALLGLAGVRSSQLSKAFEAAGHFLARCQACDEQSWLRLGLLAHGRLPAGFDPRPLPARTVRDLAVAALAERASDGKNLFL